MVYDGTRLTWPGVGQWNASSGKTGYQEKRFQNLRDKGPVPEGTFQVPLAVGGQARVVSFERKADGTLADVQLDKLSTIERLTCIQHPFEADQHLISEEWGSNRVRLKKLSLAHANTAHRSGFYLHDSNKGYSHGCIEVDTDFFKSLREYSRAHFAARKFLILLVHYDGTSTYGNTKSDKRVFVQCD